jgi:hypothetical protein
LREKYGCAQYHVRRASQDGHSNAEMFLLTANIALAENLWLYAARTKDWAWLAKQVWKRHLLSPFCCEQRSLAQTGSGQPQEEGKLRKKGVYFSRWTASRQPSAG